MAGVIASAGFKLHRSGLNLSAKNTSPTAVTTETETCIPAQIIEEDWSGTLTSRSGARHGIARESIQD
jgi:hypothetical protein